MTDVEIIKSKSDGSYLSVSVSGHSGYSEEGSDIVCSSISFLTINTFNSILSFTEEKPRIFQDSENAVIKLSFMKTPGKEADLLLKAFELGMKQLADKNNYNDFVKLTIKEV